MYFFRWPTSVNYFCSSVTEVVSYYYINLSFRHIDLSFDDVYREGQCYEILIAMSTPTCNKLDRLLQKIPLFLSNIADKAYLCEAPVSAPL